MTHGASLAPDPHLLHPPFAADIVRRLLLAAHLLGILVNLLLLCGMYWGHHRLMLPWLFLQGFLASILASLACYYLALFPLKNSCISEETSYKKKDANFRQQHPAAAVLQPFISSTSFEEDKDDDDNSNASSKPSYFSCQPLLWYGAIMILSLLILFYYFYIVNDFLDQLKADKKRKKALWKIDIELREPSEEEQQQQQQQQQQQSQSSLENVVVLDDTVPTNSGSGNDSSIIKQVTFNTSSTVQDTFYTTSTVHDSSTSSPSEAIVPPKKSSRVVWQEHVEVME